MASTLLLGELEASSELPRWPEERATFGQRPQPADYRRLVSETHLPDYRRPLTGSHLQLPIGNDATIGFAVNLVSLNAEAFSECAAKSAHKSTVSMDPDLESLVRNTCNIVSDGQLKAFSHLCHVYEVAQAGNAPCNNKSSIEEWTALLPATWRSKQYFEQIKAVKYQFSLTVWELSQITRATEVEVQKWLNEDAVPTGTRASRIYDLYTVVTRWRSLCKKPIRRYLKMTLSGPVTLYQLLCLDHLDNNAIYHALLGIKELAEQTRTEMRPEGVQLDAGTVSDVEADVLAGY